MAISSKADIKLGDDEFVIDQSIGNPTSLYQPHYNHYFESLQAEKADITGMPGAQSFRNTDLMWAYTDWSGGEGLAVYDPNQPTRYDYGGAINGRNPGRLTGRPTRVEQDLTVTDQGDRPTVVIGAERFWIAGSRDVFYSQDAQTISTVSDADAGFDGGGLFGNANYRITAAAGDTDGCFIAAWHSGSGGSRGIRRIKRTIGSGSISGETVVDEETGKVPWAGLVTMGGRLYGWTGSKLYEMDISGSFPLDTGDSTVFDKVHDTGIEPDNTNVFSAHWWADVIATENSVIYFYAVNGISHAYEYKYRDGIGAAGIFWTAPLGFTIKSASFLNGVVYFNGHWGGSSDAKGNGATYEIPLDTLRPSFTAWYRRNQSSNLQMQDSSVSYGTQILQTADNTGHIFVYDAVSLLDDLQKPSGSDPDGVSFDNLDHRVGGTATYGPIRMAVIYRPNGGGTKWQVVAYQEDIDSERQASFNDSDYTGLDPWFQTPWWDFNFPMERKNLHGFYLRFPPLTAYQQIKVMYEMDDSGSFTTLQTITSADTNGKSHYFMRVPDNTPLGFTNMRFQVWLTADTAHKPPILYSVTAFAALARKRERWQIVVRVKDELSRSRPSSRRISGSTIRDMLIDSAQSGVALTFLDGFRYSGPNQYTTHHVKIIEAQDIIQQPGEGSMRLLLEALPA
jgi:hypothetical protein